MFSAVKCIFLFSHVVLVLVLVAKASTHTCRTKSEIRCPWGWRLWGDSCYNLTTRELNWADSREECRLMGGQMMAPRTQAENVYVSSLIGDYGRVDDHWIDCNDIDIEGQFVCGGITGPIYENWYNKEPSNTGSVERNGSWEPANCVRITSTGDWRDESCDYVFHFAICKRDAFVINATFQLESWRLLASCLVDHVIYEFQATSMNACAVECSITPGCRSFNAIHQAKMICQLNDAGRRDVEIADFVKISNPLCMYGEK